jgi:hypothetical protein
MQRFGLRDDQWARIKDFLPGREGHVGGNAADNRLFVESILYRYRRLEDRAPALQSMGEERRFRAHFKLLASDHDNEYMMIDATIVRAHQHSAGTRKKRPASDRPIARWTDYQNSRTRRRLGQSRRVDTHARPSS